MKTYQGNKNYDGTANVQVVGPDGVSRLLSPSGQDRQDEYEWGPKSDAWELAVDILYSAIPERWSQVNSTLIKAFMTKVLWKLDPDSPFTLDYYDIVAFADEHAPQESTP